MKTDVYRNKIIDEIVNDINRYVKKNKALFKDIFIKSKYEFKKREKFIDDFIKKLIDEKYSKEGIEYKANPSGFVVFHGLLSRNYVFSEEKIIFELFSEIYKRKNSENVFLEITKLDNQLSTLDFIIDTHVLNSLEFEENIAFDFNDYFPYGLYEKGNVDDFFIDNHNLVKNNDIDKKIIKELYSQIFAVLDLSKDIANNDYFTQKFVNSIITGKDYLEAEKDLLMITCDINLDKYNYKKLLIDLNNAPNSIKKPQNKV